MVERSLVLVKPDGVMRGKVGNIISRFEDSCLKIVAMKIVMPERSIIEKHYIDDPVWKKDVGEKNTKSKSKLGIKVTETPEEIGERIRQVLMTGLEIGPVVAMVVEGNEAIAKIRTLAGSTNPVDAAPGSIRGDLTCDSYSLADGADRPLLNLVHASDSKENAAREISVWFEEKDILSYKRTDDDILYYKN